MTTIITKKEDLVSAMLEALNKFEESKNQTKIYDVAEVVKLTGKSLTYILRRIKNGELKTTKDKKVTHKALLEFLNNNLKPKKSKS